MNSSAKNVGVVCVTYRNPDKPSIVREFGLVALVEEMFAQDYKGQITLSVVDSSPEPHPYLKIVAQRFPEKLIYTHIPERNKAPSQKSDTLFVPSDSVLKQALALHIYKKLENNETIPQSILNILESDRFLDTDTHDYDILIGRKAMDALASSEEIKKSLDKHPLSNLENNDNVVFWEKRIAETLDIAGFVPFEDDYPIQTNIFTQIFGSRPSIGMKKNYGVQALVDSGLQPDIIVFSDDDDHHAPNYVSKSVNAIGDNDFTRMTRYTTHIFNANEQVKDYEWATFDLRISKDSNSYWRLDPSQSQETMHNLHPEGYVYDGQVGKKFSRLVTMAWPILSHEGALHSYSFNAWKRSVDSFGGCIPVSFCEDIIYYRRNKDAFGSEFRDVHTPTQKGDESFIRIADGGNASVIEWMEKRDESTLKDWEKSAVQPLYDALTMSREEQLKYMVSRAKQLKFVA